MEIADVKRTRFNVVLFDVGKSLWPACIGNCVKKKKCDPSEMSKFSYVAVSANWVQRSWFHRPNLSASFLECDN